MANKTGKIFMEKLTFENMLEAHERAKSGKMNRYEVLRFEFNLEANIVNLVESIKNNKYSTGKYRSFIVYEPKERIIKALPYIDRVVHQWYVEEFIKRYIVPKFIKDTYACILGRGTHKAVDTLQKYMRLAKKDYGKTYYILKMDIKKFFYNIDHEILFDIMKSHIRDKKLLEFTKLLIDSDDEKIGIPIGNYTSQFFANIYLDKLDKYIKHELRIKYYVRYMDDFILLVENKEAASRYYDLIKLYVNSELKLKYQKSIVIIKIGIFYETFNDDAYILNYLFKYKIKQVYSNFTVGFPESIIEIIKKKLEKEGITYVIVERDKNIVSRKIQDSNENYDLLLKKSEKNFEITNKIDAIIQKLEALKDTNNIESILKQINAII